MIFLLTTITIILVVIIIVITDIIISQKFCKHTDIFPSTIVLGIGVD